MATEYKHSTYNFLAINLTLIYCTENARRYLEHGEVLFNKFYGDYDEPYKFSGYYLDNESSLNYMGARYNNPALNVDISPEPKWQKFPSITPYAVNLNNPIMSIDVNGDSTAVLNQGGNPIGHTAMLVQNDDGKWQYYSFNGTTVYKGTKGIIGGKGYHDVGEQTFNSVEEFMHSSYNATGSKDQVAKNEVNNYGFKEAYVLPTTPEQDKTIRETFTNIANTESYDMTDNQCAQVVQRSLNKAGVPTANTETKRTVDKNGVIHRTTTITRPFMPSSTFRSIRKNNPNGRYVNR